MKLLRYTVNTQTLEHEFIYTSPSPTIAITRRTDEKNNVVIDTAEAAARVIRFLLTQDTERLQIQHNLELYIYMIATDLGTFRSRRNPLMMNKDTHVIELQKEDQSDYNLRDEDFEQFPGPAS
mmetsp:Transcript_28047/g.43766  ORF Transcript_28047/g.43766 Transcript_28047/m.43766 type:complete len:123 (+) Transcript_28047:745-1113(+)